MVMMTEKLLSMFNSTQDFLRGMLTGSTERSGGDSVTQASALEVADLHHKRAMNAVARQARFLIQAHQGKGDFAHQLGCLGPLVDRMDEAFERLLKVMEINATVAQTTDQASA